MCLLFCKFCSWRSNGKVKWLKIVWPVNKTNLYIWILSCEDLIVLRYHKVAKTSSLALKSWCVRKLIYHFANVFSESHKKYKTSATRGQLERIPLGIDVTASIVKHKTHLESNCHSLFGKKTCIETIKLRICAHNPAIQNGRYTSFAWLMKGFASTVIEIRWTININ